MGQGHEPSLVGGLAAAGEQAGPSTTVDTFSLIYASTLDEQAPRGCLAQSYFKGACLFFIPPRCVNTEVCV